MWGQKVKHLQETTEQTQRPHTGLGWNRTRASVGLLIAKWVHNVNNDGGRIHHSVGLPICGHAYLLPLQSAKEDSRKKAVVLKELTFCFFLSFVHNFEQDMGHHLSPNNTVQ